MYEKKDTRRYKVLYTRSVKDLTFEIRRTKREKYLYLCVKEKGKIMYRATVVERISQILSSFDTHKVMVTDQTDHIVPYILCDWPAFPKSYGKYINSLHLSTIASKLVIVPSSVDIDFWKVHQVLEELLEGDNARLLSLSELPDCDVPRLRQP